LPERRPKAWRKSHQSLAQKSREPRNTIALSFAMVAGATQQLQVAYGSLRAIKSNAARPVHTMVRRTLGHDTVKLQRQGAATPGAPPTKR
jgi:hypothetical protein